MSEASKGPEGQSSISEQIEIILQNRFLQKLIADLLRRGIDEKTITAQIITFLSEWSQKTPKSTDPTKIQEKVREFMTEGVFDPMERITLTPEEKAMLNREEEEAFDPDKMVFIKPGELDQGTEDPSSLFIQEAWQHHFNPQSVGTQMGLKNQPSLIQAAQKKFKDHNGRNPRDEELEGVVNSFIADDCGKGRLSLSMSEIETLIKENKIQTEAIPKNGAIRFDQPQVITSDNQTLIIKIDHQASGKKSITVLLHQI